MVCVEIFHPFESLRTHNKETKNEKKRNINVQA